MISVIVPMYNAEPFIKSTIESILNQTLPAAEIIILNDGSTDNSLQIAEQLAQKNDNIKVFTQENAGPSITRNRAVNYANYDWICFVDADDLLHPQRLEIAYQHIENCDAVAVNFTRFIKAPKEFPEIDKESYTISSRKRSNEIVLKKGFGLPRMLIKKSAFLACNGLDEDLYHNEDHEFHFRMLMNGFNFKKVNISLYYYRQHTSATRLTLSKSREQKTLVALDKMKSNLPLLPDGLRQLGYKVMANRIAKNGVKLALIGDKTYKSQIKKAKMLYPDLQPYGKNYFNYISKLFGWGNLEYLISKVKK